jgi:hypothetical protein
MIDIIGSLGCMFYEVYDRFDRSESLLQNDNSFNVTVNQVIAVNLVSCR